MRLLSLVFFATLVGFSRPAFLDWILPTTSYENEGTEIQAYFEQPQEMTKEDKFLNEAKELLKMSPLDICQHKIFLRLTSSCSIITETELLKISIGLLNCQSEAEGRKTVPCTEEMTLKECTKAMDTTTWNLYHMMSVRAKSICYMIRQQQFNAYSDMMLGRLTRTANDQLDTMRLLEEGQEKLQVMAHETFTFLSNAEEHLINRADQMSAHRKKLEDVIISNILAITEQGMLISEAQEELAALMDDIINTFDASGPSTINSSQIEIVQLRVVATLNQLKNTSETRWKQIEESFAASDMLLEKIKSHTKDLTKNVTKYTNAMNSAITYVEDLASNIVFLMQWVYFFTCNKGDREAQVWCYVQHTLLIMGNVLLWLSTHLDFRMFILIMHCDVMIYHWRVNHLQKPVNVTVEMFFFVVGQWFLVRLFNFLTDRKKLFSTAACSMGRKLVTIKDIVGTLRNWIVLHLKRLSHYKQKDGSYHSALRGLRVSAEQPQHALQSSREHTRSVTRTPSRSRSHTPVPSPWPSRSPTPSYWPSPSTSSLHLRSSTPVPRSAGPSAFHRHATSGSTPNRSGESVLNTSKQYCRARCKTGWLCRNPPLINEEFCYIHVRSP